MLLWLPALSLLAGACLPGGQPVIEREVVVTQVVEREITREVEKLVTPAPSPLAEVVTLDINLGAEPHSADPALATDTTSVNVLEQLFLGLTDFDDESGEVIPELAREWSASEDLTVWTFRLRDDVPWVRYDLGRGEVQVVQDGQGNPRRVSAHDVVFGVKRTCDPRTASDYSYVDYIITGCEEANTAEELGEDLLEGIGVRALDDHTVEFTLTTGAGYFPAIAGMWVNRPVYAAIIEERGERWVEPGFIVTNGPFVLAAWAHNSHMSFLRNPHWPGWREPGAGNIQRIEAVMVPEASTAFAMYESHELDYTPPPLEEMDRVKSDPRLSRQVSIEPILCTYYYGFTTQKPPVDDPLVRKALGAAINRQELVEQILRGGQLPANSFAPQGIFGSVAGDPGVAPWYLDPELGRRRAREWMAEAGHPQGTGLEVSLMFNTSEAHRTIAEAVQAMWAEAFPELRVTLESQEWQVFLQTLGRDTPIEERPHVWRLGWCADYPDQNNWVHEVFNTRQGANRSGLSEDDPVLGELVAQFNQITAQAQTETDPERRRVLYRQAEKLYMEEIVGVTPIYYYTEVALVKPWVQDWIFSKLGGNHYYRWSIDWEAKRAARGG